MPRKNVGQEKGKRVPATAALPTIGTKHPLPPDGLAVCDDGIIAEATTMTIQCTKAAAMRTRRLLEGKSRVFNSWALRTK